MSVSKDEVKAIFGRALDIESADDRAKYLDEACRGADQLRAEVDALLDAIANNGSDVTDTENPVSKRTATRATCDASTELTRRFPETSAAPRLN